MSEMIERVARAACEKKLWPGAFEQETKSNQQYWRDVARAAIEAMREPTEAMKFDYGVELTWMRMIDEALK